MKTFSGGDMDVSIIVGDDDGQGLKGTVPISLIANPTANLVRMDIIIDDIVKKSGPYTNPFTYNWDTTQVADGTHIIKANAVYKKRTSTAKVAVTVANEATPPPPPPGDDPVVTIVSPADGATITENNVAFYATVTDADPIDHVDLFVNDVFIRSELDSPYGWGGPDGVPNFDLSSYANGTIKFKAVAYDTDSPQQFGTKEVTCTLNVTAPPPPPPPSTKLITQTISDGSTLSGTVTWRATYTDNGVVTDPGTVRFYVDGTQVLEEADSPFGDTTGFWNSNSVPNGSHVFEVQAVDGSGNVLAANSVTATVSNVVTPPPPPPPNVGTPIFDGRAINMNSITCSTLRLNQPGWSGSSNSSQDPIIWGDPPFTIAKQGVYAMQRNGVGDITLQSDPVFGKVYLFSVGQGSTNPYLDLNSDGRASAELTRSRPIAMGQTDWYSNVFKIVSPYNMPTSSPFNVICQYGYPALTSPPLSICFDNGGLGIDRHVGTVQTVGSTTGMYIEKPRFWSMSTIVGKWVEMVIGVKWAVDNTGTIVVYARVKELNETTFSQKFSHTNTPTFQQLSGSSIKTTANDKMGLYFGRFPVGSIKNNAVYHRGFVRWDNQADAINSMG